MPSQTVQSESSRRDITHAELTLLIKEQAALFGFQKVGIVPAKPLVAEEIHLNQWLARRYHGHMAWMARDPGSRTDPRKIFPDARSVVVVALNYYTDHKHADDPTTGRVSRYAWGNDYHEVVSSKLRELLAWIKKECPDVDGKVCVDIQPVMDKAWAVRGGLGWLGKHTNVITPELGSWVFLGELLLNIDLDYETELSEDHCGSCTLCIEACPTQAIVEPYVLDSNKCISYATIELRDPEIPKEVAEKLEGWLYGCDICQDVCPWNRFAEVSSESDFQPRAGNVNTSLQEVLDLNADDYAQRYRHSAMKRAKLSGLQRNATQLRRNMDRADSKPRRVESEDDV